MSISIDDFLVDFQKDDDFVEVSAKELREKEQQVRMNTYMLEQLTQEKATLLITIKRLKAENERLKAERPIRVRLYA